MVEQGEKKTALGVLLRIKSQIDSLKPAEQKVARYILEYPEKVMYTSITHLAQATGVSEATVVKFSKSLGYAGYQELKIRLAQVQEGGRTEAIYKEIEEGDTPHTVIKKMFQAYRRTFDQMEELLENSDVVHCIHLLRQASRILFFGFGASGIVALDAELKFKRIGLRAEAYTDNHMQKTTGALLQGQEVVVAFSDSGRTRELKESLEVVRETGVQIIVVTSRVGTPVAALGHRILITSSQETPFRGSAMASRMAQLALVDILFMGVAMAAYDETLDALERTRLALQDSRL